MVELVNDKSDIDLNGLGKIILFERQRAKVSREELALGICSQEFLLRIETGERSCERIVSEALLQRIGVSMDRFMYFVMPDEEELVRVKDELLEAIGSGRYESARGRLDRYRTLAEGKSELHSQFLLLTEAINEYYGTDGIPNKMLCDQLKKAWQITKKGYSLDETDTGRMSLTEICIKIFYLRLREKEYDSKTMKEKYYALLNYISKYIDERDGIRIYPEIAYRLLSLSDEQDSGMADEVYETCKGILKKQGSLFMLPKLLEYRANAIKVRYKDEIPEEKQIEVEDAEQLAAVVRWLYKVYEVDEPKEVLHALCGMEELLPVSEIIKGRRKGMGLTQEQLAEGICDPVSLSRIENGIVGPKTTKLLKLMEKLKFPGGRASLSLHIGSAGAYEVAEKIRAERKFGRYEKVSSLIEEFKQDWQGDLFSDQYLLELESSNDYVSKKIDSEERERCVWEAFYMTVPKKTYSGLESWVFTKTEAMLINMFSYVCRKNKKIEEGLEWLQLLKRYYERQRFEKRHYIDGYELTLLNIGNLLGDRHEYEEAIVCEDIANRLALKAGKGGTMCLTLYDKAWNMKQLWSSAYTKEESRPYMWAALQFEKFWPTPSLTKTVNNHWNTYYEEC